MSPWKQSKTCEEVKKTDIRLPLKPLTSTESTALVHRNEGYCSTNQFDLIAYTFLEVL